MTTTVLPASAGAPMSMPVKVVCAKIAGAMAKEQIRLAIRSELVCMGFSRRCWRVIRPRDGDHRAGHIEAGVGVCRCAGTPNAHRSGSNVRPHARLPLPPRAACLVAAAKVGMLHRAGNKDRSGRSIEALRFLAAVDLPCMRSLLVPSRRDRRAPRARHPRSIASMDLRLEGQLRNRSERARVRWPAPWPLRLDSWPTDACLVAQG